MGLPIIGDIISAVKDIVGEVVVDKDKRIEINYKLQELEDKASERLHGELMAQAEINKTEAQHESIFVAGWRPFIGWVSGFGVGWTFVASPIMEWVSRLNGFTGKMPELETGQLMALVTAMLGVAGYRTFEKVKGVNTTSLTPTNSNQTVTVKGPADVSVEPTEGAASSAAPVVKKKHQGIFKGKLF
jgi:hypothetical protein